MTDSTSHLQFKSFADTQGVPLSSLIKMLEILKNNEEIQNYDLITQVGLSKISINTFQKQFSHLFTPVSRFTRLNEEGLKFAEEVLLHWKVINTKGMNSEIMNRNFTRTDPKRRYDQFLATQKTIAKRASKMDDMLDIQDNRILFLGDDDHTSIAVGLNNKYENITVVDVDSDILNSIESLAKNSNIKLETFQHDLRSSFPAQLEGSFDVIFTDPPYTPEGIELFLSRAIEALDPNNKSARIYFCYGHSDLSKERFLPIYEKCLNAGLMIRWIFDKFNRYTGAESIGNTSSLFICEVTAKTKSTIKKDFRENIYTIN